MAKAATCQTCIYAYWDPRLRLSSLPAPFPPRPICANQPDAPGIMRPVPAGACRNYRPKPPTPAEDVKRIPVAGGWYASVDAENFEWLNQWHWRVQSGYAARVEKGKVIYMHRQIMQPPAGMVVDHINGDNFDNTLANMRNVTPRQNTHNARKRVGTTSVYKGVSCDKRSGRWRARLWSGKKNLHLGCFETEIEAARAYDRKAVELFKEAAWLNFPEEWPAERRARVYAQARRAERRERKKVGATRARARGRRKAAKRRP